MTKYEVCKLLTTTKKGSKGKTKNNLANRKAPMTGRLANKACKDWQCTYSTDNLRSNDIIDTAHRTAILALCLSREAEVGSF